jgi:nitrate/TMAO reductase-like tetraheme cytochrome c subunit
VALIFLTSSVSTYAAELDNQDAGRPATMPSDYWRQPLAAQGEVPRDWSKPERSLAPEACAECHVDKYEEWRSSIHAKALSPGLVGQLLTFDAAQTASCMECHAPLMEQKQAFEAARVRGKAHILVAQGLAAAGNSCAGCHVRNHRRYGPPQRDTGATGQGDIAAPHGGVYRTTFFKNSEFCSACHQFPQTYAVNGKPLQNTYVEWQSSPQAAQGVTCQGCHMPDRKHLWRGIHDPEMVAAGLAARFDVDTETARFDLTNSDVGHAFPTYVTPKVVMHAVALDAEGEQQPDTAVSYVIQRTVGFTEGRWVEHSDTRLLPGETASLELPWQNSDRIRMWLEVHPDDYYDHQVYAQLLGNLPAEGAAARLIAKADSQANASRYRLFETELKRPG